MICDSHIYLFCLSYQALVCLYLPLPSRNQTEINNNIKRSLSLYIYTAVCKSFEPPRNIYIYIYIYIERERERERENTSWKVLPYGIYARVVDVSEIERVSVANE